MKKKVTRKMCALLALLCFLSAAEPASATTISDLKEDLEENKDKLDDVNEQISGYQDGQDEVEAEINDIDAEVVALLTDISLIQTAIEDKEADIVRAQEDYDAALAVQQEQYEMMKLRIQFMYEKGDTSYLNLFLSASGMGDLMNKAVYVEEVYEYDRSLLEEYEATVRQVAEYQGVLEEEKSELETSKSELEDEQSYLEEVLEQKKQEYENYSTMLAKAKQEAAAYTAQIKKQTAQIKKLEEKERKRKEEEERRRKEEEERKRREQEASGNGGNASSSGAQSDIPTSFGGGTGGQIAEFACKYVGNPYKAGGTSLTDGADCSGFVWAVYQAFGYSLPRSSYAQAGAGREVSYADAQPGDIIYYGGHVGIYIGNGKIVHASTERTGIKITAATYRNIITVRRIV